MILSNKNKEIIKSHALEDVSKECCGLIYIKPEEFSLEVFKAENKDLDPENYFRISEKDYLKASNLGKIWGYYHSHLEEDRFSDYDKITAERFKLKAVMYCLKNDKFYEYEPIGLELPFVGRDYAIGAIDCFSLIKDYYNKTYNIYIPEIESEYRFIEHKPDHKDNDRVHSILPDFFKDNGFLQIQELKDGDIILMNTPDILSPVHCAIYKTPNQILHHPFKKKSCLSLYKDIYKKYSTHFFRHRDML